MRGLKDKVAFVSGAGSGIGRATVRRLTEEGCSVTGGILDESQRPALEGTSAEVLDVRDTEQWERAIANVVARHGRLDILVHCAGISRGGTAQETSPETWNEVIGINLTSVLNGSRAALPHLRRVRGSIVSVASINAIRGNTGMAAYIASKFGVAGLTQSMAMDYAAEGVRVNCVCPGAIDTPMMKFALDGAADRDVALAATIAKHPMGRLGRAEEIASGIAFLASDDASYITGIALPVDGGRSSR
jgi:NAD(P)-dependent dehydrogenase (short-subunit alcohol dehydrogenase family)